MMIITGDNIGEPKRVIEIRPLEEPNPTKVPQEAPAPKKEPVKV